MEGSKEEQSLCLLLNKMVTPWKPKGLFRSSLGSSPANHTLIRRLTNLLVSQASAISVGK